MDKMWTIFVGGVFVHYLSNVITVVILGAFGYSQIQYHQVFLKLHPIQSYTHVCIMHQIRQK